MKLELPWPPTANTYWRRAGHHMHISARGRRFAEDVAALVGKCQPLTGRLGVRILACPPDARTRDIDNLLKPTIDALTKAGVWNDDSQIDDLHIIRGDVDRPDGRCVVWVTPDWVPVGRGA